MNFIHNIILNYNDTLYDYYEWENSDKIIHIKKIPVFRLSKKDYFNIKNNIIKFEKDFLGMILKQNQLYRNSKLEQFNYLCLIGFEEEVIGLKLNNKGETTQKSHLLIDEEKSVLKVINRLEITKLNYEVLKSDNNNPYLTRKEKEDIKNVVNEITNLYKRKDNGKLTYLYLECFNKMERNIDTIFNSLKEEIPYNLEIKNKTVDFFNTLKQK